MKKAIVVVAFLIIMAGCDDAVSPSHEVDGLLVSTPNGAVCIGVEGGGCTGCSASLRVWQPVEGRCLKASQ